MRVHTKLLSAVLALSLTASLAGCGSKEGASSSASSSSNSSASSASSSSQTTQVEAMDLTGVTDPCLATLGIPGDTVIATVGEYEVTADSLAYWLNYNITYILQQYSMFGVSEIPWDSDAGDGGTQEESIRNVALRLAASYRLIPEIGAKEGLSLASDIDAMLDADFTSLEEQLGSKETVEHYFWLNMSGTKLFRELYRSAEMSNLLQEKYFGEGSQGYPTDAEVLAYAQEELGMYRAKHILLKTVDTTQTVEKEDGTMGYAPLDEATIEKQWAKAEDLLAQLKAADDPVSLFDTLMKENSEDEGLAGNPDGYTTSKGEMVPAFEEAALALKDGEFSDIVESEYGLHIILRLPLDPADYRSELVAKKMEQQRETWLDEYGIQTTQAYEQVDPSDFWDKALSLEMAAYQEIQAIQEQLQAQEDTSGTTSSAAGSVSSQASN
ncbi:MAG: peptidylprolyl isomerase [Lawsonibacter sp.]|jgi:hypothetical protein